ncbi:hypothetical protein JCM11641_007617 [Rhodosporidiobolus odoratus]
MAQQEDTFSRSSLARLPVLTIGNFAQWELRLEIYVGAAGKSDVLDGIPISVQGVMESIEDYGGRLAQRKKDEYWVLNAIYSTVDESNQAFIEGASTAKAAMENLRTHHGATRIHTVSKLLADLLTLKLSPGGDVPAHLARMRVIQNGLSEYTTTHTSKLGLSSSLDLTISDAIFSAILLHSLPSPQFNTLCTTIFSDAENKLKSAVVYEQVLNEVAGNGGVKVEEITAMAAQVNTRPAPRQPQPTARPAISCSYCKKPNHAESVCRKKQNDQVEAAVRAGFLQRDAQGNITRPSVPAHPAVPGLSAAPLASTNPFAPLAVDDHSFNPSSAGFTAGWSAVGVSSFAAPRDVGYGGFINGSFWLDSGAGAHMVHNGVPLSQVRTLNPPVSITAANGETLLATEAGTLTLAVDRGRFISLSHVLRVEGLAINLISVARITSIGTTTSTSPPVAPRSSPPPAARSSPALPRSAASTVSTECVVGKHQARSFPPSLTPRAEKIGKILHSDVCGPFPASLGGKVFFVSFIDDLSRRPFLYFLNRKNDVVRAFSHLQAALLRRHGAKVEMVRSDRGGEYLNGEMKELAAADGWRAGFTAPHTPAQNDTAERFNRTLQERLVTALVQAGAPPAFWTEAAATTVISVLHSPHSALDGLPPAHFWPADRSIPAVSSLRPFGCAAYPLIPKVERRKLTPRSIECVFLGYNQETKGYRLWDLANRRVRISASVVFDERRFPWRERRLHSPYSAYLPLLPPPEIDLKAQKQGEQEQGEQEQGEQEQGEQDQGEEEELLDVREQRNGGEGAAAEAAEDAAGPDADLGLAGDEDEADEEVPAPRPRRAGRIDYAALHNTGQRIHANYMLDDAQRLVDDSPAILALAAAIGDECGDSALSALLKSPSSALVAALVTSLTSDTPSYREATTGPHAADWSASDRKKLDFIDAHETADLTLAPFGIRILPSHWVRRIKRTPSGEVLKFKSRVVVNGSMQQEGIDFTETFASVGKAATLRVLYALTAILDLEVEAYDVELAFLGAEIDQDVYVRPPPGFVFPPGKEHYVWKLKKSLYGLKQSPRLWKERLSSILGEFGFRQSRMDDGLYIPFFSSSHKSFAFHFLHVDDGKVFSNDPALVSDIRRHLEQSLSVKWDKNPSFYLGVAIERDRLAGTVKLHQSRYIDETLRRFNMENCASDPTPVAAKCVLEPSTTAELEEGKRYPLGQLVGCLLYLACWTRPDISAAVSRIATFVSKPTPQAWTASKRILRYLQGTRDVGLVYSSKPLTSGDPSSSVQLDALFSFSHPVLPSSQTEFFTYSDADWAACLSTRKSISGSASMLGNAAVDWVSRQQQHVATSTSHSEYQSMAELGGGVSWLRSLLTDLGFPPSGPTILCGDNQACIAMSKATSSHRYTQHIDIKYHYIRELVDAGTVAISYVPTKDMLADIFTKGLGKDLHRRFSRALGLRGLPRSRGSVGGNALEDSI